jgi:hypothetical protein
MNKPKPVRLSNRAEVAAILADGTLTAPHLVEHECAYYADPKELRLWRESNNDS